MSAAYEHDPDWLTPQEAADLLGVTLKAAYQYAWQFGWDSKLVGSGHRNGVLYWAEDVREELPNHGREPSKWDAWVPE